MNTTNRTAELGFAGEPARVQCLIAPIASDAPRGSPVFGGFVLEHHKDGESLSIFLTVEREEGESLSSFLTVEREDGAQRPEVPDREPVKPGA